MNTPGTQEKLTPIAFAPEDGREDYSIEWWFFQGHYATSDQLPRHFMVSLFRATLEQCDGNTGNGFQLLLAVLDAQGNHSCCSRIDAAVVRAVVAKLRNSKAHIDPAVQRAMLQELENRGPPHPVMVDTAPGLFSASPLAVDWNGFSLAQSGAAFALEFVEPGSGCVVSLKLQAMVPCMDLAHRGVAGLQEAEMEYRCYPQIRVAGFRSDQPVAGEAWMDHQWGNIGWFFNAESRSVLGWDWFGINLDNGTNFIVVVQRYAQTGAIVHSQATVGDACGTRQIAYQITLTPLRYWESADSHIRYPVAWSIDIPECQASFTFQPLADDQEVACFGSMRSIWEGAGRISGSLRGEPVTGRARGEFHGYGYIFDHQQFMQQMADRVGSCLAGFLPRRFDDAAVESIVGKATWVHEADAYTKMLSVPLWDLLDRSGKRWRPVFGILMLEALGVTSGPYEELISSLELIHTGALIVDDIEDQSALRRGEETLHLRYGLDVALNAGNALYFLTAQLIMNHPSLSAAQRLRLHEIKERVCIDAHCGQATDIYWSKNMSPERLACWMAGPIEAKILQMYAFKTAAACKGMAECVCAMAGVDAITTAACADFGLYLGVGFQIIDDIHNFRQSAKLAKTAGEDIANSKLTYVIATALRRLEPWSSSRLTQVLCSPETRNDPVLLQEGIDLVRLSGALEACRDEASDMIEQAWERFAVSVRPSQAKIMLHAMCLKFVDLALDA